MARAGRHLALKDGIFYYKRRVPALFADVDPRKHVRVSLDTRDLREAERRKLSIEKEVEGLWIALKKGNDPDARQRYLGAIERTRLEGFEYRTHRELASESTTIAELVARLERLEEVQALGQKNGAAGAARVALLGQVPRPELTLTKAVEEFFRLTSTDVRRKSPDQLRRWKAPRLKAVNNLVALIGDKALTAVTRADAIEFRTWWADRVNEEGYTPNSANKDLGHLAQLFDRLNTLLDLQMNASPFAWLRLPDDEPGRRPPFTIEQLKTICAPDALAGVNDEARDILLTMVENGMRPVEICGLRKSDIFVGLDEPIPYVDVKPRAENAETGEHGRELKTVYSRRKIPLVGISLEAMRRHPEGFPRYFDKSAQWSALINKVLRERGLLPTEDHTAYSIRHTFQDRLTAANMPDRIQAQLMGHKFDRPEYGIGGTLEQKLEWLTKLAIT